jgi:hypothetical protein
MNKTLLSRGWLTEVYPAMAVALLKSGQPLSLRKGQALYSPDDSPGGMFGVVE